MHHAGFSGTNGTQAQGQEMQTLEPEEWANGYAGTRADAQGLEEGKTCCWLDGADELRGSGVRRALADPMVEVQMAFLKRVRMVVGASLPPTRQLSAETSQLPMQHIWAHQHIRRQPTSHTRTVWNHGTTRLESESSEHE